MGFPHEYLIRLADCWRWKPEKLAERRKAWPETLTWSWFLDPDRVTQWDRKEQLEILSVATLHAHRVKAPLWAKPALIYRQCEAEQDDAARLELYRRLGNELDAFDERVAATARQAAELELERQRREREAAEAAEREAAELERLNEEERIARLSELELEREREAAEAAKAAEREAAELERQREQQRKDIEARILDGSASQDDMDQYARIGA